MNYLNMDVGGIAAISSGDRTVMYPRNFSSLIASGYAGDVGAILLKSGSA